MPPCPSTRRRHPFESPSRRRPTCASEAWITATVVAVVVAGSASAAQQQFDELRRAGSTAGRLVPPRTDSTSAVAAGDVDGDGDLDLVFGNGYSGIRLSEGAQDRLYLNDGLGVFEDATAARMPVDNSVTFAVAMGDVDDDGDPDLVFGDVGQTRLYLNVDGTGTYADATATHMPVVNDPTRAVAMGDVDGDGDLDLVVGNLYGRQDRLYLNDGSGQFAGASAGRLPVGGNTRALAFGDVDGDGDLDLAVGQTTGQNRLYLNDGAGAFSVAPAGSMPAIHDDTFAVAFGDVDGDGDLDLVFGNGSYNIHATSGHQNRLYLNNGHGRFQDVTAAALPVDRFHTHAVALADVDGDGDLDIVFGNNWRQNSLYLNDGSGVYSDASGRLPSHADDTDGVAVGDVDADGDVDLVFGNNIRQENRVYLNLLRQLDAPLPLRLGQSYELTVYSRYIPLATGHAALPLVSTGRVSIPLPPLGTLGVHPGQGVLLPPLFVPQPAGVASLSFPVPNTPGLVGIPVYAQALMLTAPVQERLTNVTGDVIAP